MAFCRGLELHRLTNLGRAQSSTRLGDVFSARIAGNFVNEDILGSLEFACAVAGAKLIVVLGHSGCGAIKGACDHVELGHLTQMLAKIGPAVDRIAADYKATTVPLRTTSSWKPCRREREARVSGIRERSTVLRDLLDKGEIGIVGGMYDVGSGAVEFIEE